MILFDTNTDTSQVIATRTYTERRFNGVLPLQVNGNYAVWEQSAYQAEDGRADQSRHHPV